jgi:hypothetical protein
VSVYDPIVALRYTVAHYSIQNLVSVRMAALQGTRHIQYCLEGTHSKVVVVLCVCACVCVGYTCPRGMSEYMCLRVCEGQCVYARCVSVYVYGGKDMFCGPSSCQRFHRTKHGSR